jgi:type II secretory pathway component PulK
MRRSPRRGFALLAVLWVIVGLSAILLAAGAAARQSVGAADNRARLTRGRWAAEECAARVRARASFVLSARPLIGPERSPWAALDSAVGVVALPPSPDFVGCSATLHAAGDAMDLNTADGAQLGALLVSFGVEARRADSLADAILDWRDADALPRPAGAERDWYVARSAHPPADAPFDDVRQLADVRGVRDLPVDVRAALDTLLTADAGRLTMARSPLVLLATLPGLSSEAVARLAERRLRRLRTDDLLALSSELSPAAQEAIGAHYGELISLLAPEPDAWVVRSRAPPAGGGATVELRLVRSGTRAAVVRHRSWP